MRINHHPDDSTILAYVAGALEEGFSLVLAAHMESCPSCSRYVRDAMAFGGALLTSLPSAEAPDKGLADVWKRIEASAPPEEPFVPHPTADDTFPAVLIPYLGDRLDRVRWRTLVPGIRQCVLKGVECGSGSVRLFSILPGTAIPKHTHRGSELTLVLKGAYHDEVGRFQAGDLADLDSSVEHRQVVDGNTPCICLIATDGLLRFKGNVSRMLQPILGI